MKLLSIVPLFFAIVYPNAAARAQAQTIVFSGSRLPGPRPVAVYARYHGVRYPVVGAKGTTPLVLVDGHKLTADFEQGIAFGAGDVYAPGSVSIQNLKASYVTLETVLEDYGSLKDHSAFGLDFEATLIADHRLEDVYVVFIAFDRAQELQEDAKPQFIAYVKSVGTLTPEKPRRMFQHFNNLWSKKASYCCVEVFSGGRQVKCSGSIDSFDIFLDQVERYNLRSTIEARSKGPDVPPALFRSVPLDLPDSLKMKYGGKFVRVKIDISDDGTVADMTPVDFNDSDLAACLGRSIRCWLFLPRVSHGTLVDQPITLRLPL
jgi:hypothetical protein